MDQSDRFDRSDQTDQRLATARAYWELVQLPAWGTVQADLVQRFGANPFRSGKPDDTAFYCGCQAVLEHVLEQAQIGEQNRPLPEKTSNG